MTFYHQTFKKKLTYLCNRLCISSQPLHVLRDVVGDYKGHPCSAGQGNRTPDLWPSILTFCQVNYTTDYLMDSYRILTKYIMQFCSRAEYFFEYFFDFF